MLLQNDTNINEIIFVIIMHEMYMFAFIVEKDNLIIFDDCIPLNNIS